MTRIREEEEEVESQSDKLADRRDKLTDKGELKTESQLGFEHIDRSDKVGDKLTSRSRIH